MVKGAGLKIPSLEVRGFKSLPSHHLPRMDGPAWSMDGREGTEDGGGPLGERPDHLTFCERLIRPGLRV